ncbi:ACP S-malonyltransferase [Paenibacillus apiarius]|uniref:[acyl-carrier-protein] S-malonyltransferase n=1 Tax=Paenibacillus apiarius TaxID=46240 RepID=A0ABT4DXT4_9BACL|nr:ACP S-malonyltransferase [Paenibacillus apiarius]MCY9517594.1 ACP S-malonyltransferase [Paenibacillus apiarius]MCY9522146.1 ACP S-malonyltransferase [Paenibacillus apiarius]MCY9554640.1 ACP S-malonyltransferase [Paenibacillus apiarius]MCY9559214.1 ACP S-malonyltransferase [Paenibacillus apiarius]MCY9683637.1 ACP S-malonyltransferase [Paenibacillus apiarius]
MMMRKAFYFPGQGSQYVGMGKTLCENSKIASDVFAEASDALSLDLKKLCFEGDQANLTLTHNAQPAILTTSVAMFRVLMDRHMIKPDLMAGHSLGEITALTCAGAIDFADAVRIVRKRGELMQEAIAPEAGCMVSVLMRDVEKLEHICHSVTQSNEVVSISNYNSRTQTVISGHRTSVDQVVNVLNEEGIKSVYLNVSAPFHCSIMQPVATLFEEELNKYRFNNFTIPVLSNVTAKPYLGSEDIIPNLTAQIYTPVRWVDCMLYAKKYMIKYGVEVGPGHVLKKLMNNIFGDTPVFAYDHIDDIEKLEKYIQDTAIPFLSRCLGIFAATRNKHWDSEQYQRGVIEPYNKLSALQSEIEKEGRAATEEEMQQAITMLLMMFKTKQTSREEQIERLKELFRDSNTETMFEHFDYNAI